MEYACAYWVLGAETSSCSDSDDMISFLLLSLSAEDIMIEEEVQRVLLSKSKMPGDVIMHHAG